MKISKYIQYPHQDPILEHFEHKNEKGQSLEEISYDELGQAQMRVLQVFDQNDKLIKVEKFDEENELIESQDWFYANGKIDKKVTHYPEGGFLIEQYTRDEHSLLITSTDDEGSFEGSIKEVYNEKGSTIEVVRVNFQNKIDNINRYEYNQDGQLTKISAFDGKNYFLQAIGYIYDAEGNRIAEEGLNAKNQVLWRILYKYHEGKMISQQSNTETTKWEYQNDLIYKTTHQHPDGSAEVIVHEYAENRLMKILNYQIPFGDNLEQDFLIWTQLFEYQED